MARPGPSMAVPWRLSGTDSARTFRHERQEPAWIVHGDPVQRRIVDAGGLELWHEHRDRSGVTARGIARNQDVIRESGLNQTHDQRYHRGVTRAALAIESHEGATTAQGLVHIE